ncbi:MAG: YybH family protein [Polymorphobacter sp.]|uniref:YybH family protein n=1 Tax=Polymorphobacter sp. TaxID=1909290 RepID=UPI003A86CCA8
MTPATADDEAAVRAAARQWITHFKAGDLDALMALYTPTAHVALHDQPILSGLTQLRAYFTPLLTPKPDADFLLLEESLEIHGQTAIMTSHYWFTLRTPDSEYKDAGRSLLVYKKSPTGWLIHRDIDQTTPDVTFPPPPEAN